jgi:cell division protein FtsQ
MNLALLDEKKLISTWKQNGSYQEKNQKEIGLSERKSKQKGININLGSFFQAIINGLAKVVLIVAFFYGFFLSYRFINQSPYFNINQINLVGQKKLSNEELYSWIGPIIGENIFKLELDKITKRLVGHPWVKSASVGRVFPQGIYVEIKERVPFAKIQLEQVYVMDNYGVLLGINVIDENNLPTITGIKTINPKIGNNIAEEEIVSGLKIMNSLNRLSIFEKNQIDNVHISNRHKITFSTHTQNIKVHMRPETAQESFENLVLALGVIEKNEKNLSDIDLSFKNRIVIKNGNEVKRKI